MPRCSKGKYIISKVRSMSTTGSPPSKTPKEGTLEHPYQMLEPPQLTPYDTKEWLFLGFRHSMHLQPSDHCPWHLPLQLTIWTWPSWIPCPQDEREAFQEMGDEDPKVRGLCQKFQANPHCSFGLSSPSPFPIDCQVVVSWQLCSSPEWPRHTAVDLMKRPQSRWSTFGLELFQ